MENRSLEPSPIDPGSQITARLLPGQKRRFIFPLLRLQPMEPEASAESLPAPDTPPCSLPQSIDRQSLQTYRLPDARAPNVQSPPVYLLHTKPTSTKVEKRARFTGIPAEHKDKEIGAIEALLGCAILILIAIFVMMVLYYVASY